MSDITIADNWALEVLGWLWKTLLTILAWIGIQQYKRLGAMEQSLERKADKTTLEEKHRDLSDAFKEYRQESREDIRSMMASLDEVRNFLLKK